MTTLHAPVSASFAVLIASVLGGCGDDSTASDSTTTAATTTSSATDSASSGGAGPTTTMPGSTTSTSTTTSAATGAEDPTQGEQSTGGPSSSDTEEDTSSTDGSSTGGELELEGDAPEPVSYTATDDAQFELLPDSDSFTDFSVNGDRLQILPLRDENFPPDVDYCDVGSDEALNELQQWARARLRAETKTWYYNVTITAVAEEDGESEFALVINGEIVDTFATPNTGTTPGVGDMEDVTQVWTRVPIRSDDVVEVWGKAHSNGELEEDAGCRTWETTYAWARGRWRRLDLVPTPGVE